MPTFSHSQLPLPKSWDEFEDIVVSAVNAQKPHSNAQRFGRTGQTQNGVDIYFEDSAARRTGVQCKLVESLTIEAIKAEIAKAEYFSPTLESYVIAFGGKRDAALQKQVYTLSNERSSKSQFRIEIWFWEDIGFLLSRDSAELARHFPQLYAPSPTPIPVTDSPTTELLRRRLAAHEEVWNFRHRCLPARRYPDEDWHEALEIIALDLDRHARSLDEMIGRLGAILPNSVRTALKQAHIAAEDGMFEVSLSGKVDVPQRAVDAAERMYDSLTAAVRFFEEELGQDGVRFA